MQLWLLAQQVSSRCYLQQLRALMQWDNVDLTASVADQTTQLAADSDVQVTWPHARGRYTSTVLVFSERCSSS